MLRFYRVAFVSTVLVIAVDGCATLSVVGRRPTNRRQVVLAKNSI
jgi:hypothetical protein